MLLLVGLAIVALIVLTSAGATASGSQSETPPPGPAPFPPISGGAGVTLPGPGNQWDNQIAFACTTVGISDPRVWARLKAIVEKESGFDPGALGDAATAAARGGFTYNSPSAGAISGYCSFGLGQVNACAHPDLAASYDLLDGNQNLLAAAQIFAGCLQANGGDLDAATRCYNGSGPKTYLYLASVRAIELSWGVA